MRSLLILLSAVLCNVASADLIDSGNPRFSAGGWAFELPNGGVISQTIEFATTSGPVGTFDNLNNIINYTTSFSTSSSQSVSRSDSINYTTQISNGYWDAFGYHPPEIVTDHYVFLTTLDLLTMSFAPIPADVPVFSYSQRTAQTGPVPQISTFTLTGTWTIQGPTETATGPISVTGQMASNGVILLERSANGPITSWSPQFGFSGAREASEMSVVVNGRTFTMYAVPEPSMAALYPFAAMFVLRRKRSRM
ncbi:MAG: hypothetical protein KDB03_02475 [Planctomycetales bacterium]|nr:hypothetical protein [Planctomycetales bacterium]